MGGKAVSMVRLSKTLYVMTVLLFVPAPVSASETITYSYDAQGRLVAVAHSGTVNNGAQASYAFDNADNRTNVTVTGTNSRVVVVPINHLAAIPIPDP